MSPKPYRVLRHFDWDSFVSQSWEKKPTLLPASSLLGVTTADVFAGAVTASDRYRTSSPPALDRPSLQLTVDRLQPETPGAWLPRAADATWKGYSERLKAGLSDARYALIINIFHSHAAALWSKERSFFDGLWKRVGMPLDGAITTLFHGDYDHSPVGVHLDRFSTFMFCIEGRKRMRFWAKRPWPDEHTTAMPDYQPYLSSSFTVELGPGDALYWPWTYYHVGENLGTEPATSVNVGVPRVAHKLDYSLVDLRMSSVEPETSLWVARAAQEDGTVPYALPTALRAAVRRAAKGYRREESQARLRREWSKRVFATGFEPVPRQTARAALPLPSSLRAHPQDAPVWTELPDGSFCGTAFDEVVPLPGPTRAVKALTRALGAGRTVRASSLPGFSSRQKAEARAALARLFQLGALVEAE